MDLKVVEIERKRLHGQIETRCRHHPPMGTQVERYQEIRDRVEHLSHRLVDLCPPSPELTAALSHLDLAMMQANAAIARHEQWVPIVERRWVNANELDQVAERPREMTNAVPGRDEDAERSNSYRLDPPILRPDAGQAEPGVDVPMDLSGRITRR